MVSDQNDTNTNNPEFFEADSHLKLRVGSGGLSENILEKAQKVVDENSIDFLPMAEKYFLSFEEIFNQAKDEFSSSASLNHSKLISSMTQPIMQLKANGGMFHYPLVSKIAGLASHFLENIKEIDEDSLEVIGGFHTALRALITAKVQGNGGKSGRALYSSLDEASTRYFARKAYLGRNN